MSLLDDIVITKEDKLFIIRFNRPRRKNALTSQMFTKYKDALKEAENDDDVTIVVVTGTGDYYTSGNDLTNFTNATVPDDQDSSVGTMVKKGVDGFHEFVKILIDYRKPIVGVVNGPAVGIGVTSLGLFDIVYASDRATFNTPFTSIGQSPEGCSSYIFPKLMGYNKATEMLVFGKTMTATEAQACGLVTEVFPDARLSEVWPRLHRFASLPRNTMMACKNIIRVHERDQLHKINGAECDTLAKRFTDDEFLEAVMKFLTRKSKL